MECAKLSVVLLVASLVGLPFINAQESEFGVLVQDVLGQKLNGVTVLHQGEKNADFDRPLPKTLDANLLSDFEGVLGGTQEFHADGNNLYRGNGEQFVVSIADGYVNGILGSVFDGKGRVYTQFTKSVKGLPETEEELAKISCKRFKKLATTIQKYGHMYYHFVEEVLPRVVLLRPFMDEDTKLLVFGASYETAWLQELGISQDQIELYDPTTYYCADELLVPSTTNVITPAKEDIQLVRKAFNAEVPLPAEERNTVIYCSRKLASERHVVNEDDLVAAIQSSYPDQEIVIYNGDLSVQDTVDLFKRAKVVVGMHGAGLSHVVFCAPGTSIVEFLFLFDPPMMFWHTSGALGLDYHLIPLAQSWWLAKENVVPEQDVLETLASILGSKVDDGCAAGSAKNAAGQCATCPAGTYKTLGMTECMPCLPGRVSTTGSAACSICPFGTFSHAGEGCKGCAPGLETMFAGSYRADQCQPRETIQQKLTSMFTEKTLIDKLVSVPVLDSQDEGVDAKVSRRRNMLALLTSPDETLGSTTYYGYSYRPATYYYCYGGYYYYGGSCRPQTYYYGSAVVARRRLMSLGYRGGLTYNYGPAYYYGRPGTYYYNRPGTYYTGPGMYSYRGTGYSGSLLRGSS